MSKRQSSSQSNTLFNYFQSPKNKPKAKELNTSASDLEVSSSKTESKMDIDSDSDEEQIQMKTKKRSRIRIVDSDSDSENVKSAANTTPKSKQSSKKLKIDSDLETKPSKTDLKLFTFEKSDTASPATESKLKINISNGTSGLSKADEPRWTHEKLDFLKPNKIRDINRNKLGHPDYDPRTLYVPEDYLNTLTPAMRQWWILKSRHMDSVLFFKVGKFYELYHMDATVGVNNLGFSYMKGDFAHSGFPETAYGRMASSLIEQGFKVARVEQTETPEMMAERIKGRKATKYDKVVNREICQISTKGMCIYGAQMTDAKHALPCYMLALTEKKINDSSSRYGVCFIDTSIGIFHMSEFDDDKHCSRLLALFAQHPPGLVLTERSHLSNRTNDILKRNLGNVRRDVLASESQFHSASTTVEKLLNGCYFKNKEDEFQWPPILKDLISNGSHKPEFELTLKALGACMWYLKDSEIDIQILSMGKFEMYYPVDTLAGSKNVKRDYMVLDAITMDNLKLLGNNGTLQKTLDHCETAFGKRLLQQWICRPLCEVEKIVERQNAVKELLSNPDMLQRTRAILNKLPDLERQIAKIHTFGNRFCAQFHPDSRAIFYEAKTYSKRKIFDLLNTIHGFERAQELTSIFSGCESRLLRKLTQHSPKGMFIDLTEALQYFRDSFDQKEAEKEGKIIPQQGIHADYDKVEEEIKDINEELDEYLQEQRKFFGCQVNYFGSDKKRFQLDIIESKCHKVTNEYQLEGTKKGSKPSKRYSTSVTKDLLARMLKAESERAKIIQDLNRRIFETFSERYEEWDQVTLCLTIIDVLCALAEYARTYSQDICLPTMLPFSNQSTIKIENGRHPCVTNIENFVPNDTEIGTDENANILILTGPNMGGKSTLMRQVALIAVMAQIGSYVPAESCQISLVDRIFTRLGAQDDIIKGQSTFLVELSEASAILQHATKYSFVLLDELGRGTSTHDGNAIATAYVQKLTEIQCRTMFSTHYHTLVEYFIGRNDIQLGHMACMVENEDDVTKESVTFLYKMADGLCPKSYGFNVAKLAGLPQTIVYHAREIANTLEGITKNREMFAKLFISDPISLREIIVSLH